MNHLVILMKNITRLFDACQNSIECCVILSRYIDENKADQKDLNKVEVLLKKARFTLENIKMDFDNIKK